MNSQTDTALTLPVMEHFYTLQGEGYHQGKAAYFIRLGGCDVGCVWCDVKDSWNADIHPRYTLDEIVSWVKATPAPLAVITGGEPLMHQLDPLTTALHTAGIRTHIETSGAHPLSGQWDWICLSPKKFKKPLPAILPFVHEPDFVWAEEWAAQVKPACKLYLQPEWDKSAEITPLIVDYIKTHPQWQLSLQVHKYIQVP